MTFSKTFGFVRGFSIEFPVFTDRSVMTNLSVDCNIRQGHAVHCKNTARHRFVQIFRNVRSVISRSGDHHDQRRHNRHHSHADQPYCRLFVFQHICHSPSDSRLPELHGNRAVYHKRVLFSRTFQQRHRISLALVRLFSFYHAFVTRKLNVPAIENIRQPYRRIKPIDRHKNEGNRLCHIVQPAEVRFFMRDYLQQIFPLNAKRKIDFRSHNAEDKRRLNAVAPVDSVGILCRIVQRNRVGKPAPERDSRSRRVQQNTRHSGKPNPRADSHSGRKNRTTASGFGLTLRRMALYSCSVRFDRLFLLNRVLSGEFPGQFPDWFTDGRGAFHAASDRVAPGHRTCLALNAEWTDQLDRYQPPHQAMQPLGRAAEHQSKQ